MSDPAVLPESLRKQPQRYLRDLQVGEEAGIPFPWMEADSEGRCFLDPDAKLLPRPGLPHSIRVERREDGYHVTAKSDLRWELRDRP